MLDREPEVLDRVIGSSREALAARHVVEEHGVVGVSLDQLLSSISSLGVVACLVEGASGAQIS